MTEYSVEEKVQIIKWIYSGSTPQDIPLQFAKAFDDRSVPIPEVAADIVKKFEISGCITNCQKCIITDKSNVSSNKKKNKNVDDCSNSAEDYSSNPKQAKIPKFQDIPPEDRIRRLEFCDNMLKKIDMVKDLATNILFTGEHIFTAVGHQTPAEIRCWIKKNIQMSEPTVPQSSEKIVVWVGILNNSIIGPIFIDGHMNAKKYLQILQGVIIPTIKSLDINIKDVWLQHDGLPVHNAKSLKSFLKGTFDERIIGFNGTIIWPPRSSDLSPIGFFILGYLKHKLYGNINKRPMNIDELCTRIKQILKGVTPEMFAEVRQEFLNRIRNCKIQNGGESIAIN